MKIFLSVCFFIGSIAFAGVESSLSGNVVDPEGAAVGSAPVQLLDEHGKVLKETTTSMTGDFTFFPVDFGSYELVVKSQGLSDYHTKLQIASSATPRVEIHLEKPTQGKELVVNVKEKRNLVNASTSGSKKDITKEDIQALPEGDDVSLSKLLATTTPGIVAGPFGQMFIRGNHANIQYQIDGVQLPDSGSTTFGQAFSPRIIDHMEVITGGIPAEYGERLAAVVNVVTKSGPEKPEGTGLITGGSYNTLSPSLTYGGSDESGKIHYFVSMNYNQTDRGLDTPQPKSYTDQNHGGEEAVHDKSNSNEEFVRVDYLADNNNKYIVTAFNSQRFYQIPNFPSSFKPTDPYFSQIGYTDAFGNQADQSNGPATTFNYTPSNTNDTESESNTYMEFVWKHSFDNNSFLQVAPYFKLSQLIVTNDLNNDLYTAAGGTSPITGASPTSFAMNRSTNNYGLKIDDTIRWNDQNLVKVGLQTQESYSNTKSLFIQQSLTGTPFTDSGTDQGNLSAVFIQDNYSPLKSLSFNLGLRYTGTQFKSSDLNTVTDGLLQPRIGIEYLPIETTKLHFFYGKLFQPAPFEDLRKAFSLGQGLAAYDIKAEKDDYYEVGVTQQIAERHVVGVNYYYKDATNMLDDAQLFTTPIAQPYNFAHGFAYGVEMTAQGEITDKFNYTLNFAHENAQGRGITGGLFAFPVSAAADQGTYSYLDHVQIDTANLALTYKEDNYWTTLQSLYGSGLRTGPSNGVSLPEHLTFNFTYGYKTAADAFLPKAKISFDILNITDNAYPITIANGFNGSHYAAGREFMLHLAKDF